MCMSSFNHRLGVKWREELKRRFQCTKSELSWEDPNISITECKLQKRVKLKWLHSNSINYHWQNSADDDDDEGGWNGEEWCATETAAPPNEMSFSLSPFFLLDISKSANEVDERRRRKYWEVMSSSDWLLWKGFALAALIYVHAKADKSATENNVL